MNAIDTFYLEMKLLKYFSEFSAEGLIIPIYKEKKEVYVKIENGLEIESEIDECDQIILAVPEHDRSFHSELFERFFQRKKEQNKRPNKMFIEFEKEEFKEEFQYLLTKNKYRVAKDWVGFLDDKLYNQKEIKTEIATENPFSIEENFLIFKYLDSNFKFDKISKYSYIYDFIFENLENTLTQQAFFEYIKKEKPELGIKTFRTQPTATNHKKRDLVKKLYSEYQKENTK